MGKLRGSLSPWNRYKQCSDAALLRAYVDNRAQQAFTVLVERYINLVYSSALRQLGDHHLAEDTAQAVFIILAQKAPTMTPNVPLPAWLFRTTRFACANARKVEARRRHYESVAALAFAGVGNLEAGVAVGPRNREAPLQAAMRRAETPANNPGAGGNPGAGRNPGAVEDSTMIDDECQWSELAPLLDGAIAGLNERDRQAVLLRYFAQRSLRQVGEALGLTENAARMRVDRAVGKLKGLLKRKGVVVSGVGLGLLLTAHSAEAAPPALAGQTVAAVASEFATEGLSDAIAHGTLTAMEYWATVKFVALVLAICLAVATVLTTVALIHPLLPRVDLPTRVVPENPGAGAGLR